MNIHIMDDFLPEEWATTVFDEVVRGKFVFEDYTVDPNIEQSTFHSGSGDIAKKIHDSAQFVSMYMMNNVLETGASPFLPYLFAGIFASKTGINTTKFLRCKANMNIPSLNKDDKSFYAPHIDVPDLCGEEDYVTAIYYLNDSTGDTLFFSLDESNELQEIKKVSPKRNRIVYFDGSILHAGSPPLSGKRFVLNMNFLATFKQPKKEV